VTGRAMPFPGRKYSCGKEDNLSAGPFAGSEPGPGATGNV